MAEFLATHWWIGLITVPALAIAIKLAAERSGAVPALSGALRRKLAGFEPSFPGHWVVTATTRDGRRFSRVVIDRRFRLVAPDEPPFELRDVAELAWEGTLDGPPGPIVPLS